MSTRIHHPKSASTETESETSAEAATSSAQPSTATSAAPPLVYLDMPPVDANIPKPASGFVAGDTADYRAVLPRDAELRALPIALSDLTKFKNYAQVLGETAPPYARMLQALTVANAWSSMRTDTAAWDAFCGAQEGIAWTTLRALMEGLQPSFELAKGGSSNVGSVYAGLTSLLAAKKVIARKAASTRKMNKQATAKGEAPTHGRVGKARQRKAEKQAFAAAKAAASAPAPVAGSSAATASPAPQPASPSPAAAPSQATGANGAANGTTHS